MGQQNQSPQPPRWASKLLEWLCPKELLEEVQGDLQELLEERAAEVGKRQARREYLLSVMGYLRPFAFKRKSASTSKPLYIDMFYNHLTIAGRNLLRQKSYSLINIGGLTLGFTCFLLLYMAFRYELSYDTFHSKADRIYRVNTNTEGQEEIFYNAGTPYPLAGALRNDVTGIEKVFSVNFLEDGLITINGQTSQAQQFKEKKQIAFVEADFFSALDYEWISGDPANALNEPYSVVLTEAMANKYFDGHALYKTITLENKLQLKVTGIVKDLSSNTVLPFKIFVAFQSLKEYVSPEFNLESWRMIGSHMQTFVLLPEHVLPQQIERQFPDLIHKYLNEKDAKGRSHTLQPLQEIHFDTRYALTNQTPVTAKEAIWIMLLIGIIILFTACINYINLSTAQAIQRSKEVGVRKLLGSSRLHLFSYFINETLIITSIAALMACILSSQLLPWMNGLLDITVTYSLTDNYINLLFVIGCVAIVSLLAGLYPAWILSGFELTAALKNQIKTANIGGLSFRRGLVIMQFFIAQLLIIATIIIINQVEYFTSAYVGFDKEAIVTVPLPDNKPALLQKFRRELMSNRDIQSVSFAFNPPLSHYGFNVYFQYKASGSEDKYPVELKPVDTHYIKTYGLTLLAGQNLSEHDSVHSFVVNEALIRKMGLSSPEEAIGKSINLTPGNESPQVITGVIADFHSNSLHQPIHPCVLLKIPAFLSTAGIKISAGQIDQSIQQIEEAWKQVYSDQVFEYQFLDEAIAGYYQKEIRISNLLKIATGIALFIGCLGVYGLLTYIAAGRKREIGIRKTLGASAFSIVILLSKESIMLIMIACMLAWPLGGYIMHRWLENFSYQINLSPWIFVLSGAMALLIAVFTIGFQSVKAALANPVDSLRNE